MKKSMAIAAGAAAAFAAAFLPLKNFCKDRLDKSIVSQIPESPEKYIKVFGFKDKAGNVFIEIVQISDSWKYRSADIDGGGILELKDAE